MPVNSKQQQLSTPEVVTTAFKDMGVKKDMLGPAMLGVVRQGTLEGADTFQHGNTVFVSNIKEKNGVRIAMLRAFNADTARNYIDNGVEYFKHIIELGVQYVFMSFQESSTVHIFKAISRPELQERVGAKAKTSIRRDNKGTYLGVVRIMQEGEE
jgi:hypothetical protein